MWHLKQLSLSVYHRRSVGGLNCIQLRSSSGWNLDRRVGALNAIVMPLSTQYHPMMDENELQALYQWVDEIPLSRPKRNIARDFSDGM